MTVSLRRNVLFAGLACLGLSSLISSASAQSTAKPARTLAEAQHDLVQTQQARNKAVKDYHAAQEAALHKEMSSADYEHAQQELSLARKTYNDSRRKVLAGLMENSVAYREAHTRFEKMEADIAAIHKQEPSPELAGRLDKLVDDHVALFDELQTLEYQELKSKGVLDLRQKFSAAQQLVKKLEREAQLAAENAPEVVQARERTRHAESDLDHARRELMGASAEYAELKHQQLLQQQQEMYRAQQGVIMHPGWYGYPYVSPYGIPRGYGARGSMYPPGGLRRYVR